MIEIPCKKCITMAICINKSRVECKILSDYIKGKVEPQKSYGIQSYMTLFQCDGITTQKVYNHLLVKAYRSRGEHAESYFYATEENGLRVMIKSDSVLRVHR